MTAIASDRTCESIDDRLAPVAPRYPASFAAARACAGRAVQRFT
jgi:hypothetical protein